MPYLVRDRLFFGNIGDAISVLSPSSSSTTTTTTHFTRVLSLLSSPSTSFFSEYRPGLVIPSEELRRVHVSDLYTGDESSSSSKQSLPPERLLYVLERAGPGLGIVRMAVPIRDTEDEDLLDFLEVCLDFIEEGRRSEDGGAVLVHCFAGVSRSAAIIIAYLMRTEQKSLEDALECLKQICEFICPNDGFLDQLKMFEEMGFKVDTSSPLYKRFRLKILGHSYKIGEKLDSSIFEDDPGLSGESRSSEDVPKKDLHQTMYRCKKCRRVVALQENVVSHVPGEGETCFEWNKRKSGRPYNAYQEQDCSSLFVEPLKWMTPVEEGALEGKLSCIHCDARLGSFNWSGVQCSCGSWITPAFQIIKSKVDFSTT